MSWLPCICSVCLHFYVCTVSSALLNCQSSPGDPFSPWQLVELSDFPPLQRTLSGPEAETRHLEAGPVDKAAAQKAPRSYGSPHYHRGRCFGAWRSSPLTKERCPPSAALGPLLAWLWRSWWLNCLRLPSINSIYLRGLSHCLWKPHRWRYHVAFLRPQTTISSY